jgi:hypothetical protein
MNAKDLLIASTVAMLFITGAVNARADQSAGSDQVKCVGVNSCKGQSSWHSAHNDCKGKNACKGQGSVEISEQECKDKGGTVAPRDPSGPAGAYIPTFPGPTSPPLFD